MANYEMMRSYLDHIVAGEFDAAMEYFADDVTVHMPGWKTTHGKAEYMAALQEMMSMVGNIEVEEHDLLVSDDHAVVLNAWHITNGDRDERVNHVVIYHTTDDKIAELWIVAEDQKAMESLMS